jgi:hypothetical protein
LCRGIGTFCTESVGSHSEVNVSDLSSCDWDSNEFNERTSNSCWKRETQRVIFFLSLSLFVTGISNSPCLNRQFTLIYIYIQLCSIWESFWISTCDPSNFSLHSRCTFIHFSFLFLFLFSWLLIYCQEWLPWRKH